MQNTANISAYFKDVATRHPDILHTAQKVRFYDMEWTEMMQAGAERLKFPGWTLVIEDYQVDLRDNQGDYVSRLQRPVFYIGRSIDIGKTALKHQTWVKAEEIAMSIIGKMRADERDQCNADVPIGVKPPREVDLNKTHIHRVQIPFADHAFGVRVVVGWRTDDAVELDRDMVAWLPREED